MLLVARGQPPMLRERWAAVPYRSKLTSAGVCDKPNYYPKGVCFERQHTRRTTTTRGPIRSAGPRTRAAQTVDGPAQRRGHNKVEPAATDAGVWMWVDCRSVAWCAGEVLAFREMCRQAGAGVVVGRDANRRWEPAQAPRGGRIWVLGCRGGSAFGCGGAVLTITIRETA